VTVPAAPLPASPAASPRLDPATHRVPFVRFTCEHDTLPQPGDAPLGDVLPTHAARSTKSGEAVSFCRYTPGARRGRSGVQTLTAVVFDLDHLSAELARGIVRRLRERELAYLLYTSFSHRVGGTDDCCFRVVLLPSRAILPREYPEVWASVDADLGGHADRRARDVARLWFTPACPAERLPLATRELRPGRSVDVEGVLADAQRKASRPPRPRRIIDPVRARPGLALQLARHRLNHDPTVRERAALHLDARLTETRAVGIPCPQCGRPSVWFWLAPTRRRTASCNHRKSCGWWGFLDTLLDLAGGQP
jgi:hypothetical protein